ncbi:YihY/virulence factor BrkB family protein [Phycicoccus sp. 3266]|uniref:YihY/virulence factor BrkB family protein n=1 Tax=Phycicoccus sp. 3266 TaxID=2817751 RepID=UPI00285BA2DD|nr:YihY/virulence factor BrkB family protein [Phycicoccus sp. 3266]MDR6862376.1 membrane protein [Phycicoccus sp. 3266]
MQTLKQWWARFQTTSAWRAWKRYGDARGNLLAGGVGYFAFFSVFPAVLLAFTIFGFVLRGQPGLLEESKNAINDLLPGFVQSKANPNGVIRVSMPTSATLSVSGIISVVGLVLAGTGWLSALRDGIRAVFGVEGSVGNPVVAKLRDLGVLLVLGVGIVLSAAVGAVAGAAARWLGGLIGLGGQGWVLTLVSLLVGVALDGAIVLVMLRLLSGVDVPWHGLRNAAVFGGISLTLLKKFGSVLLASTTHNKLYLGFALVVGLLVWLNFMSRVLLISAAWAANDLDESAGTARQLSPAQRDKLREGPAPEPLDSVRARTDAGLPTFGPVAADRTTLAAGLVLGAVGATALGTARRGLRALLRRH